VVVLVTGVSSSPGYKAALSLAGRGVEVVGVYNQHPVKVEGIQTVRMNLVEGAGSLVREYRPTVVIHTAALGNVDLCEEQRDLCYKVNVEATRELFREAYRVGAKIFYLSTDYVFDGTRGLYREDDVPSPVNFYGLTKLLGEEAALALGGTVVRTSAVYGVGPGRPNFGKVVAEKLLRGETVKAFTDQWLSPTLNTLLGEALAKLALDVDFEGVLHVAGPRMSRYEFAVAVARAFGLDERLVEPASMNSVSFKAPRPRDSSLDVSTASRLLGLRLNDVDYALSLFRSEFHHTSRVVGKRFSSFKFEQEPL
jgi:dTDP-4-dehydrorhamnose reductase